MGEMIDYKAKIKELQETKREEFYFEPPTDVAGDVATTLLESLYLFPNNEGGLEIMFLDEEISISLDGEGNIFEMTFSSKGANEAVRKRREHG